MQATDGQSISATPNPESAKSHKRAAKTAAAAAAAAAAVVPPHKVGRLVMYDQYVPSYDAVMSRLDCSAIRRVIAREIRQLLTSSNRRAGRGDDDGAEGDDETPSCCWRIADLGCGSGRGSKLVVGAIADVAASCDPPTDPRTEQRRRHRHHFHVCGADKSAAMVAAFEHGMVSFLREQATSVSSASVAAPPAVVVVGSGNAAGADRGESMCPASSVWTAVSSLENFLGATSSPPIAATRHSVEDAGEPGSGPTNHATAITRPPLRPFPVVDVVICAWALSHVMSAQWGGDRWHGTVLRCLQGMERLIDPASGGVVVIVETLGTATEAPSRKSSLHEFMEAPASSPSSSPPAAAAAAAASAGAGAAGGGGGGGFRAPEVVRTDYFFETAEEGERMSRFFFGEEGRRKYLQVLSARRDQQASLAQPAAAESAAPAVVAAAQQDGTGHGNQRRFALPECTGVWIKRVPPSSPN